MLPCYNAKASGTWDYFYGDTSTPAHHFKGHRMRLITPAFPTATSKFNWNYIQVSGIGGLVYRVPHLVGFSLSQPKPSRFVAQGNQCVETSELSSIGLFLDNVNT